MAGKVRVLGGDAEDAAEAEYIVPDRPPKPKPERATEDVLIERPDLGRGAHTLVRKGDPIPVNLTDRPRRPVGAGDPAGQASRGERKSSRGSTH
jgi:hypothetical protein